MLHIENLTVQFKDNKILNGLNLSIQPGSVHALMGPNGSGKSTLALTLMGHPRYQILQGSISYNNQDVRELSPDKRAKLGIFLAFQHPCELPGVTVRQFLKESYHATGGQPCSMQEFQENIREYFHMVGLDSSFLQRSMHEGFSGGEKKKLELVHMLILKPSLVILDEIDSGLDIDALKRIEHVISYLRTKNQSMIVIIITHYHRILEYITPDHVHIMMHGSLVKSGGAALATLIEKKGYDGLAQI